MVNVFVAVIVVCSGDGDCFVVGGEVFVTVVARAAIVLFCCYFCCLL